MFAFCARWLCKTGSSTFHPTLIHSTSPNEEPKDDSDGEKKSLHSSQHIELHPPCVHLCSRLRAQPQAQGVGRATPQAPFSFISITLCLGGTSVQHPSASAGEEAMSQEPTPHSYDNIWGDWGGHMALGHQSGGMQSHRISAMQFGNGLSSCTCNLYCLSSSLASFAGMSKGILARLFVEFTGMLGGFLSLSLSLVNAAAGWHHPLAHALLGNKTRGRRCDSFGCTQPPGWLTVWEKRRESP